MLSDVKRGGFKVKKYISGILVCIMFVMMLFQAGLAAPKYQETVYVSTAEEFLAALGSNKKIVMAEGVYNLSTAKNSLPFYTGDLADMPQDSAFWSGSQLFLGLIQNLTIEGPTEPGKTAEIVVEPRSAYVMFFAGCKNIMLNNVTAGHTVAQGGCSGGVFWFMYSEDINMNNVVTGLHVNSPRKK